MARKQDARAARLAEPATPSLEDEQEMLCLALLAYRGFADVNLPIPHAERLWLDVVRGLETLAPVRHRWELVWGPVSYRAPLSPR